MKPSQIVAQLQDRQPLSDKQTEWFAESLIDGSLTDAEKADLLRALSAKGETVQEIVGFVKCFLRHAIHPALDLDYLGPAIDVCGTGGDRMDLFNISTTSMFILAAGGAVVVKHGNRGITSKSGGADVLEALGIRIDMRPENFVACVEETGIGFMFAPNYHPAFKAIAPLRRQLAAEGVRTIFNLIGPLLNPVQPLYQLVGVASARLPGMYAEILAELGRVKAWVVHGTAGPDRGMDEFSTIGPSHVAEVEFGQFRHFTVRPEDFGMSPVAVEDIRGGDATENARILRGVLSGEIQGARRDIVLLNAAAGFMVTAQSMTWENALAMAREMIDSGQAMRALTAVQEFCRRLA